MSVEYKKLYPFKKKDDVMKSVCLLVEFVLFILKKVVRPLKAFTRVGKNLLLVPNFRKRFKLLGAAMTD